MAYMLEALPSKKSAKRANQSTEIRDSSFPKFAGASPQQSTSSQRQSKTTNLVIPISGVLKDEEGEHISSRADQNSISLKSNSSTEKKCHVYVHHYSKVPKSPSGCTQNLWWEGSEIHQNMYKHEFNEYYDAKIQTLKKQFDNLNLRKLHTNSTNNRFPKTHPQYVVRNVPDNPERGKQSTKAASAKSSVISKANKDILFKPEYKAAIDKLEETYWAKWKPSKPQPSTAPLPKAKGLYTENEKVKTLHQSATKSGRKERGDSNQTLAITPVPPEKSEPTADQSSTYTPEFAQADPEREEATEEIVAEEKQEDETVNSDNEEHAVKQSEIVISAAQESDAEDNPVKLKHTDSFILTTKKQSEDKPRYQQPKCIKLFKNSGYSTSTAINYFKGGSYPLKSCLKNSSSVKPSHLGRPGSPIRATMRSRHVKTNRYPS